MDITKFFDCHNIDHIVAYREIIANGQWPDNFIPEGTNFIPGWQVHLAYQMADAWIKQALAGNVIGIPPEVVAEQAPASKAINIVFDGPPAHQSGRFVEVENDEGQGISVGEWIDRKDGYWAMRIEKLP